MAAVSTVSISELIFLNNGLLWMAAHCLKDLAESETTQLVVSGAKWCRSHVIIDL